MKIIGAIAIVTILGIAASIGIRGTGAQTSCIDALTGDGTISGTWSSDCISQNTPTEPTNPRLERAMPATTHSPLPHNRM